MTDIKMAAFKSDAVETEIVSESNSVTYKLELGGATDYSVAPFIKRNGVNITQEYKSGINVREFNNINDLGTIKSFLLTNVDSTMNTSFATYMNQSTAKLIILFSGKSLRSSDSVDALFSSWKSVNWPGKYLCNNYSAGYVGIYSPSLKRIVYEVMISSDGNEKGLAELLTVYDDYDDIGFCGSSNRVVYDPEEYTTQTGYEYKKFPTDAATNLLSAYGLQPGKPICISASVYQTQAMLDAGVKTRVALRWLNGTALISNTPVESKDADWSNIELYSTAPSNATGFTIVVSRYPRNDSLNQKSSIKNMVVTQVSKNGNEIKTSGAVMGVNGIRASKFIDTDKSDNHLLKLDLGVPALNNIVPIVGLKEGL